MNANLLLSFFLIGSSVVLLNAQSTKCYEALKTIGKAHGYFIEITNNSSMTMYQKNIHPCEEKQFRLITVETSYELVKVTPDYIVLKKFNLFAPNREQIDTLYRVDMSEIVENMKKRYSELEQLLEDPPVKTYKVIKDLKSNSVFAINNVVQTDFEVIKIERNCISDFNVKIGKTINGVYREFDVKMEYFNYPNKDEYVLTSHSTLNLTIDLDD